MSTRLASNPRRHALKTLAAWALAPGALTARAAEVWISGITRTRLVEFATEALSNLPENPARAALPRMVQFSWTFDPATVPDSKELSRVQGRILANAQEQAKTTGSVRLVATGRSPESAFWCMYTPESFKASDVVIALADFDAPDQALAVRLRNRLSYVQRRDPFWTWAEAYLREMRRK